MPRNRHSSVAPRVHTGDVHRVRRRSRAYAVCALVFLCVAIGAVHSVPDEGISTIYFDTARQFLDQGEQAAAEEMLQRAIDFDPDWSDPLYLLARQHVNDQSATHSAERLLRESLDRAEFRVFSELQTRYELVDLLLRTQRPREALQQLEDSEDDAQGTLPETAYRRARALYALGETDSAGRVVEEYIRRVPNDWRFRLLRMRELSPPDYDDARLLAQYPESSPGYLDALAYYIRSGARSHDVRAAISRYLALGGSDPVVIVAGMESGYTPDDPWRLFVELNGVEDMGLLRRFHAAAVDDARSAAEDFVSRASGRFVLDADRDGFYEQAASFESGELREWSTDEDQNGIAELHVHFVSRVPTRATLRGADDLTLVYGDYPSVARAEIAGAYELQFGPDRVLLDVRDGDINWQADVPDPLLPISRPQPMIVPDLELLQRLASHRVQAIDQEGSGLVVHELYQGVIQRAYVDADADAVVDEIVSYQDGLALHGYRDPDEDGVFEFRDFYRDGELSLVAVDEDDDRRIEFVELLGSQVYWDTNGDAMVDITDLSDTLIEPDSVPPDVQRMFSERLSPPPATGVTSRGGM